MQALRTAGTSSQLVAAGLITLLGIIMAAVGTEPPGIDATGQVIGLLKAVGAGLITVAGAWLGAGLARRGFFAPQAETDGETER